MLGEASAAGAANHYRIGLRWKHVVLRLDEGAPGGGGKVGIAVEVLDRRVSLERLSAM